MRICMVAILMWGGVVTPAPAYVDFVPTIGKLIDDSTHIVVLRVEKVRQEKRAIHFKKVADLKGTLPCEQVNHQITYGCIHASRI